MDDGRGSSRLCARIQNQLTLLLCLDPSTEAPRASLWNAGRSGIDTEEGRSPVVAEVSTAVITGEWTAIPGACKRLNGCARMPGEVIK